MTNSVQTSFSSENSFYNIANSENFLPDTIEDQNSNLRVSSCQKQMVDNLKSKLPEERLLCKKAYNALEEVVKKIFENLLPLDLSPLVPQKTVHIYPEKSGFNFAIEVNNCGQTFGLLKQYIEKGKFKKIKYGLDLQNLIPTAHASIELPFNKQEAKYAKKLIRNEASIQSSLKGYQEFVQLFHISKYETRSGKKKMALMMEYCNYGDLFNYMGDVKYSSQLQLWRILRGCIKALKILEDKQIHHRDIKLENFFLICTGDGIQVKLGDFGFTIFIEEEKKGTPFCGTALCCAPEFAKGHFLAEQGKSLVKEGKQLIEKGNAYLFSKINMELGSNLIRDGGNLIQNGLQKEKEGYLMASTTKGDIWGLGILLYEMRTGGLLPTINYEEDLDKFLKNLTDLQQETIDQAFPNPGQDPLEDLNMLMLRVDPNERISANECLEIFEKLTKNENNFLKSNI